MTLSILSRRRLLVGLAGAALAPAAVAAAALPIPPSGSLAFKALRNGSDLGSHVVRFSGSPDALTVTSTVEYVVYLGPIAVFRYRLEGTETWQGTSLVGYVGEVDDDGTKRHITAKLDGDALVVAGAKSGGYRAPPGVLVSSHWNMAQLKGPMINAGTGDLMHFTVAARGSDPIRDVAGTMIPADRFSIIGPDPIDLWYDRERNWAGLRATADDHSVITYERR